MKKKASLASLTVLATNSDQNGFKNFGRGRCQGIVRKDVDSHVGWQLCVANQNPKAQCVLTRNLLLIFKHVHTRTSIVRPLPNLCNYSQFTPKAEGGCLRYQLHGKSMQKWENCPAAYRFWQQNLGFLLTLRYLQGLQLFFWRWKMYKARFFVISTREAGPSNIPSSYCVSRKYRMLIGTDVTSATPTGRHSTRPHGPSTSKTCLAYLSHSIHVCYMFLHLP